VAESFIVEDAQPFHELLSGLCLMRTLLHVGTTALLRRNGGLARRDGTCKMGWGRGCEIPSTNSVTASVAAAVVSTAVPQI
jgi:hypothetical protein